MNEILGLKHLIDDDFVTLVARLFLNLFFATIVIRFAYQRLYKNREFVFTYFMFNIITFCLCFLLRKVPMELGFALGLFAVFGILRYRTEPIRIRDLTYLFIVIGIGILNAVANKKVTVAELVFVNSVLAGMTVLLELRPAKLRTKTTPLLFDDVALLAPGKEELLHKSLQERLGYEIEHVQVQRIDFLRDAAEIIVTHKVHASPEKT